MGRELIVPMLRVDMMRLFVVAAQGVRMGGGWPWLDSSAAVRWHRGWHLDSERQGGDGEQCYGWAPKGDGESQTQVTLH